MSDTSTITKPRPAAAKKTAAKTTLLNTTHRCDRCGAQAWVKVTLKVSERLPEGGTLLFCGHDYRVAEKALAPFLAKEPLDERHRLVTNRLKGSENS